VGARIAQNDYDRWMSQAIHKEHNVSVLIYHLICPTKYRRVVITKEVEQELGEICKGIALRFEINFLEIGADKDHVHFLIQTVPVKSPSEIARIIKSLTAREIFRRVPSVKEKLWGGEFWTDGYYISTVGRHGYEEQIRRYVAGQGRTREYVRIYTEQLRLL
jgi:REP element-mobilizing transposase RayT